ncbi:hypothetical protein CGI66_23305 [Vibrio parahaemolyticus]|nr:hypothetical protein CGI66_23305 [Vibrio parahaemolyticus]
MALVFTAQWFSLGGMRCSPLNAALCDGAKFLVSSNSLSLAISFSVSANRHCRLKFLNHSNRETCQSS